MAPDWIYELKHDGILGAVTVGISPEDCRYFVPTGFRFLVQDDMAIVEPVLLYLHERTPYLLSFNEQEVCHGSTTEVFAEYKREAVAMLDASGVTVSQITA